MPSKFKKRLKQLHGSRQRRRRAEPADGVSRVFTADDVDETALGRAVDPLDGVGERWRAQGASTRPTSRGEAFYLVRHHPSDHRHGHWRLRDGATARLEGLGKELVEDALHSVDPRRLAFVDLETNGLSKQSYPFCIGVGLWDDDAFAVYHVLMTSEADEPAALEATAALLKQADGVCTFNGATFDVPMLLRRFRQHGIDSPLGEMPHLDLLPVARERLPERKSHKLSRLEVDVLGFRRRGDIPGAKIPAKWQRYLDSGEPKPLMGVFEHNRLDILSMVVLVAALGQAERGDLAPAAPSEPERPAPARKPKPTSRVASKLARTYALRKKAASPKADTAETPARTKRDSVKLDASFSRSQLRRGMPIGTRLRELRRQVERLGEQQRADDALALLHEMVALSPRNPFALEKLVAYYRQNGQPGLAEHYERRLQESSPF